jgi:hypothetical protein
VLQKLLENTCAMSKYHVHFPSDILNIIVTYLPTLDKHRTRLACKELDQLVRNSIHTYKLTYKNPGKTLEEFIEVIKKYPNLKMLTFSPLIQELVDDFNNRNGNLYTSDNFLELFSCEALELAQKVVFIRDLNRAVTQPMDYFSHPDRIFQQFPRYSKMKLTTPSNIGKYVTHLTLQMMQVFDESVLEDNLTSVRTLQIIDSSFSPTAFKVLLHSLPELTELYMVGHVEELSIDLLQDCSKFCPNLTRLSVVSQMRYTSENIYPELCHFKKLRHLEISQNVLVSFDDLSWLATSDIQLETYIVPFDNFNADDFNLILANQQNLCHIDSRCLQDLNFDTLIENCKNVRTIILRGQNGRFITKAGICKLIQGCENLEDLFAPVNLKLLRRYAHDQERIVLSEARRALNKK